MSVPECKCQFASSMVVSSLIGLLLSIYTTHVEIQLELDNDYEALCDLNEGISCTKVFSSQYGKGFGIVHHLLGEESIFNQPNGLFGIFFYALIALLCFVNDSKVARVQIYLCIVSNLLSLYLAYLLYFVLEDFCIVCVSTYVVNGINLYLAVRRYRALVAIEATQKMGDDKTK
ncbi:vitamin K epoxide reductase complex subunit 1 [Phlebotomus argentipes]|uniref:vitamin K epoxide reductase complex subunit 1 n=1 Tax=Phlebotomus argentipes TaxID=94469 RepID=UPI002892BCE1|nr:vitamin K epoxide reductase complex subunit 1 [Phlebotomus argentipes]